MSRHPKQCALDTTIATLGAPTISSPLPGRFVSDDHHVTIRLSPEDLDDISEETDINFQLAGPQANLYFEPTKAKIAIVTCGGLCPGLNDVIHAIVMEAHHNYHAATTVGARFGLQGFISKFGHEMIELTPASVSGIHQLGGTILGTSRGPQPIDEVVDTLERLGINMLFVIGGDGTMKAAMRITEEVQRRGIDIAVIGVPKTIDNDINLVTSSFGFDTAVEKAGEAIRCAHTEAISVPNGIGMVKLMGRESGFIAAQATLALKEVNCVLIPEAPFALEGKNGLLPWLEQRLVDHGHAVIVVAEGAGQHLLSQASQTDASGNPVLGDIAGLLIREIGRHLKEQGLSHAFKYIDPSYLIRSVPANANDRVY
ncbi:MAG TPA: ATP-dependent 6-phosphofructokinase, partial [Telmatospirillum sp.]|nr:ATP-dependent 6-phosphofructokinase [Telmatospirillum sp.]